MAVACDALIIMVFYNIMGYFLKELYVIFEHLCQCENIFFII